MSTKRAPLRACNACEGEGDTGSKGEGYSAGGRKLRPAQLIVTVARRRPRAGEGGRGRGGAGRLQVAWLMNMYAKV